MTLKKILDAAAKSAQRTSLAVFDLDSTVFDLTRRVTKIVNTFAIDPKTLEQHPAAVALLKNVEICRTDWGLTKPLERAGIFKHEHPEFFRDLENAWRKGFFSNEYLEHDFAIPGAPEFVDALLSAGADILYLTGRDRPRMEKGTLKSLRHCGFALDDYRARLQMKPTAEIDDALFKADTMAQVAPLYENIWFFENEPVNINATVARVPRVEIVFVDTCHSGKETVQKSLCTIKTFNFTL